MHDVKHAQPALPAGEIDSPGGPRAGFDSGMSLDRDSPPDLTGEAPPRARRARRRRRSGAEPMTTAERKRRAAVHLRKAYGRIKSDFSEAYEHCRSDTQRHALERAHGSARAANQRALEERLLDDRDGWGGALAALRTDRGRAARHLGRLATADAVMRILKRLAEIEEQLAVLAG